MKITDREDSSFNQAEFETKLGDAVFEPIKVEYIDHMGSDKRVCNVARVSMDKWEDESEPLSERDVGLLNYLATGCTAKDRDDYEKLYKASLHWSPFAHCTLSIRCTVPFALGNQLHKHQVGIVRNEVSRRYVSTDPTFWVPDVFHIKPESVKQGAGSNHPFSGIIREALIQKSNDDLHSYKTMLIMNVCPEEARLVLPMNTMTTFVLTGSVMAMLRIVNQRMDSHAQLMAQEFAKQVYDIAMQYFPASTEALKK